MMNQSKSLQRAHKEFTKLYHDGKFTLMSAIRYVCKKHGVSAEELSRYRPKVRVRKSNTHLRG
jgi:predicted transcriptional regulator YheO